MIFDTIENIKNYSEISQQVEDFILNLSEDIKLGKQYLNEDKTLYANIEEYTTKTVDICKLEAHKKYIDIQLLLSGNEELDYTSLDGLTEIAPYSEERDIVFFEKTDKILNRVILEKGKFALLYPHEAHQPQMAFKNQPSKVKKVVVKIPVK